MGQPVRHHRVRRVRSRAGRLLLTGDRRTASATDADWQRLSGGTMSLVERRGDVVRRRTGFWSPPVHALLSHLETVGFDRSPRLLGVDGQGRELLSYLPGEVPRAWRWVGDDRALVEAARLLRRYHDAVAGTTLRTLPGWDPFLQEPPELRGDPEAEVVCHNDFAVYNCVFVDGLPQAMIDFDGAAPGSRGWDLAWTAFSFVPLNPDVPVPDRPRRLRLICDAYGLTDRSRLVDLIEARLERLRDGIRSLAGTDAPQGDTPPSHLAYCERSLRLVRRLRPALESALR
ncbi:aminoglycoside phosphotransferase family protein [Plantactinospora sp. BB1]|uniref:phosphotransferase n=1 Tax=Plantactinospora sp. BB1 TaxID=2071627 RepID=UPI00131F0D5D|nr:aminoglycoside phosphotransferase family protein [Plantactinospora sp. BB1]